MISSKTVLAALVLTASTLFTGCITRYNGDVYRYPQNNYDKNIQRNEIPKKTEAPKSEDPKSHWENDKYNFSINFDSGSNALKDDDLKQIRELALFLKEKGYGVEIQGHADTTGTKEANRILSKKRAQVVTDQLIKLGIPKDSIYAVGYGDLVPVADNGTEEGRLKNRRIVGVLIINGKININNINVANSLNIIDVKKADNMSFIGYYKMLDPRRSYAQYHVWLELYGNENGLYGEYQNNRAINNTDFAWFFNKSKSTITLDYTNKGKRRGWAKFEGKVVGNTNHFTLSGHWGGGQKGVVEMSRISSEEVELMKSGR